MPHKIVVPRLGWSMEEGTLVQWLKAPGDSVEAGEAIYVLEGDKASQDIESVDSGTLYIPSDAPQPGSVVKVGEVVGFLLSEGELAPMTVGNTTATSFTVSPPRSASFHPNPIAASNITPNSLPSSTSRVAGPAARRLARELGIDLNAVPTPDLTGRVLCSDIQVISASPRNNRFAQINSGQAVATPRARRTARQLGIDWTQVEGSGRDGRIRQGDILTYQQQSTVNSAHTQIQEIPPSQPGRFQTASKLRQAIARRMSAGVYQAAPVTLITKVDAQLLVACRQRFRTMVSADETVPSYNDILIHLVAQTLREQPDLNACWYRSGIHTYSDIHIATAVDTPGGLLAPVVHHADQLSVTQITTITRQLISLAQTGGLTQSQLSGATFTVSNLGMFGIDAFTPILNLHQAAILGIGRIIQEPVVRSGRLEVGETLSLSLTFDHRVIDGAPAARWLQRLSERIIALGE